MKKYLTWVACATLLCFGCAMRVGRTTNQQKAERLASERGRLAETDDPAVKTNSYIVISGILLDFAEADIRDGAFDVVPQLLGQYVQAITDGRDTLRNSDINPQRVPSAYRTFEVALDDQIGRLNRLVQSIPSQQRQSITSALETATAIREQVLQMLSPTRS
jgi:hypothetical protein